MNINYIMDFAKQVLAIDSPTGYTKEAIDFVKKEAQALGYSCELTNKGNLIVKVQGKEEGKVIGYSAHVDTLGLMVRSIKSDGTLAFTLLGGPQLNTVDGEYCRVVTRDKKVFTGTILSNHPAAHVHKESSSAARTDSTMHIRLDEKVSSKKDVEALGINTGDFICIDTKTTLTESGFLKSRFLDDKISVAILVGVMKALKEENLSPTYTTYFLFSTYEEVGHGSSYIPQDITELISVDMGCIGLDLNCTEFDVSICAKDSGGPYDYELTSTLIELAKKNKLSYAVDIYPFYGSDTGAALRAGNDIRGGLIGPGVAASHGMERTHKEGVLSSAQLVLAYCLHQD